MLRFRRHPSRPPVVPPPLAAWCCPACHSDGVAQIEDEPGAVLVRCGDCGAWRRMVLPEPIATGFRRHVAAGVAQIAAEADRLTREADAAAERSRRAADPPQHASAAGT